MWKQTTTNTCHMSTLLTVERQAGICRPKLVGSNTGIVAKMLFCHIGNSKKRSCTIIFNSYSLLTIDQSRRQKKKKKVYNSYIIYESTSITHIIYHRG